MEVAKLRRSAAYVVILGVAVYLYVLAGRFQFEPVPGRIGPDVWPKLVLSLLTVACLWQIGRSLLGRGALELPAPLDEDPLQAAVPAHQARQAALAVGVTIVYAFALPVVGFWLATTAFIALVTLVGGYRRPWPLLLTSLIAPIALVFVFMKIVYLSLPLGQGPFKSLSLVLLQTLGIH